MYRYALCRALIFLFLTILWLAFAACGSGGGSSGSEDFSSEPIEGVGGSGPPPGNGTIEQLSFRTLEAGEMSHITTARLAVARTPAEYSTLWAQHRTTNPPPAAPAVDFDTEIVVAVFIGTRVASGFGAEIVSVDAQGTGADVSWNETVPGASCPAGLPVVTSPYVFAAITKVEGSISFQGGTRAYTCP